MVTESCYVEAVKADLSIHTILSRSDFHAPDTLITDDKANTQKTNIVRIEEKVYFSAEKRVFF